MVLPPLAAGWVGWKAGCSVVVWWLFGILAGSSIDCWVGGVEGRVQCGSVRALAALSLALAAEWVG